MSNLSSVPGRLSSNHGSLNQRQHMYSVRGLGPLTEIRNVNLVPWQQSEALRLPSPAGPPHLWHYSGCQTRREGLWGKGAENARRPPLNQGLPDFPIPRVDKPPFTLGQATCLPWGPTGWKIHQYHPHGDHSVDGDRAWYLSLLLGQKRHIMHLTCTFTCMACVERQRERKKKSQSVKAGIQSSRQCVIHGFLGPVAQSAEQKLNSSREHSMKTEGRLGCRLICL